MQIVALDIECGTRADAADFVPEPKTGNRTDPAKIEAHRLEKRAQALERGALDATLGRVLAVGTLHAEGPAVVIADDQESVLLTRAWDHLSHLHLSGKRLVTFCGHRFDFPFLARRSWALGVPVPLWFPNRGRFPWPSFIDLAELWSCGDRGETISLDRLARLCGLPGKTGSGDQFSLLWANDREAAIRYLETDLRLTLTLAHRILADIPDRDPLP